MPVPSLCAVLPANAGGRDFVVGDIHGHFPTLRRALAELEVGAADRLLSVGDLVDRGPSSEEALDWMTGDGMDWRFDLVLRGNHEQMMLEALAECPLPGVRDSVRDLWYGNGGQWWETAGQEARAAFWMAALSDLPFAARVETAHGPVGLVHACPVHRAWRELERVLDDDSHAGDVARTRAIWSRAYFGRVEPLIGEDGSEWQGPVEGVRAVLVGHTRVREPVWAGNVLHIETGVYSGGPLTLARIDGPEIETWSFHREGAEPVESA